MSVTPTWPSCPRRDPPRRRHRATAGVHESPPVRPSLPVSCPTTGPAVRRTGNPPGYLPTSALGNPPARRSGASPAVDGPVSPRGVGPFFGHGRPADPGRARRRGAWSPCSDRPGPPTRLSLAFFVSCPEPGARPPGTQVERCLRHGASRGRPRWPPASLRARHAGRGRWVDRPRSLAVGGARTGVGLNLDLDLDQDCP